MKRLLLTFGIVLVFGFPAQAKNLNVDEMRKAFVGKRVTYVTKDGYEGSARYSKNGSAKVTNKKPERCTDRGSWRIKGNKFCNKWEVIRDGKEKCFTYKETGKGVYLSNTGTVIRAGKL